MKRNNKKIIYPKIIENLIEQYTDIQDKTILTPNIERILLLLVSNFLKEINSVEIMNDKCQIIVDMYLIFISPIGLIFLQKNLKFRMVLINKINDFRNIPDLRDPYKYNCNYLYKFLDEVQTIFDLTFNN